MKKIRPYLIVWVSGVIAGVVMIERWRRTGAFEPAAPTNGDAAGGAGPTQVPADNPTVAAAIIVGAKSDVEQVWRVFTQLGKGRRPKAPSLSKFARSGLSGAPESTPSPPA